MFIENIKTLLIVNEEIYLKQNFHYIDNQSLAFKEAKYDSISTFPPLMIQHTLFPLNIGFFRTAAITVALEGSITIFIL